MNTHNPDTPTQSIEAAEDEAAYQVATKSPLRGMVVAGGGILLGCLLVVLFLYI